MASSRFVNVTDTVLKYESHFFHLCDNTKQLFTSSSVIISEYSPIVTSPLANDCLLVADQTLREKNGWRCDYSL